MLMWRRSRAGALGSVSVAILLLSPRRELDRLPGNRRVSPERMPGPVVRQHDARQVRMPAEVDSKEVVDLALVPVQPGEHVNAARSLAGRAPLQPEPGERGHRIPQVIELEAVLA